jgi:hypothetical protein
MPALSLNDFAKQELGYQPGTRIPAAEANKIRAAYNHYLNKRIDIAAAAERPAMEPQIRDVPTPDGKGSVRMAQLSNGSWQVLPEYKVPEMRMTQAEDGTIILVDPVTGSNFPSYNKDTGAPVKGAKKADPFAALLGGAPQSAPVGQSGAATLEPPAPISQSAPAPAPAPAPAEPQVYSISGEEDYAKVPPGATVSWNGQTFIKR